MTAITLQVLQAEQVRLAQMIEAFQAQTATPEISHVLEAHIELNPGEHYAGIVLGRAGEASYHLVLLPGEEDKADWEEAMEAAAELGGYLPTRREQALLFCNLRDEFEPQAYWCCEQHASGSGYAWCQNFDTGFQRGYHKSAQLRARAVRRLPISVSTQL